ncbi:MAG: hydrogenase formation protein HypD, partial [Phycisphaerales bacterium]|nr:hydrogenase formation protein HypD [Phycisphaerales bacterium]
SDAYIPIVQEYGVACVIGGFEPTLLLAALACLTELAAEGKAALVNQYPQAVSSRGNGCAQALLTQVFEASDAHWRGMGVIAGSGLSIRKEYERFDAQKVFDLPVLQDREPKGCLCGQVISGQVDPPMCSLFARACTPVHPIGPCMVSSEGTCAAWFKYGQQRVVTHGSQAQEANV